MLSNFLIRQCQVHRAILTAHTNRAGPFNALDSICTEEHYSIGYELDR